MTDIESRLLRLERKVEFDWYRWKDLLGGLFGIGATIVLALAIAACSLVLIHWALHSWHVVP